MPIINRIADFHADMTEWRRELHQHPELSYEERWTSEFVAKRLEEFGIEVHRGLAVTGVVGVEFTSASTCNKGGSFSTSCTAAYGGSASFPLQLPKPLRAAKVGILGGLNENGDCAGSFEKPSAPPGFLCVYPGQTGSSGEYFDKGEADIFNVAKNGDGAWAVEVYPLTGNASKFGFRISAVASLAGPAKFYGTWAYTAPTKEIPLTDTAS